MGQQTGAVLVAFISAHIGLLLSIACIYPDHWITASKDKGSTDNTPASQVIFTKGLWRFCYENTTFLSTDNVVTVVVDEQCFDLRMKQSGYNPETGNQAWFTVTQFTYSAGLGCSCFGVVLLYAILCIKDCRGNLWWAIVTAILFIFAGILELVGLVIVGQQYQNDYSFSQLDNYDVKLGWTFYVGVASDVFLFMSAIIFGYVVILIKSGRSVIPYNSMPT